MSGKTLSCSLNNGLFIEFPLQELLLLKHRPTVSHLNIIELLPNGVVFLEPLVEIALQLGLLLVLILEHLLVLSLLLCQILKELTILLFDGFQSVSCICSKLLNQQKPLDRFRLDLAVVGLDDLQASAKAIELLS